MAIFESKKTLKALYKFGLETVKLHRFAGGHRINPAYHAELLDDAHFWLEQLKSLR